MMFRRNVDEELRLAEREAATGDPQAIARYVRLRLRRGEQVTAWALQAIEQDPRERLRYLVAAREELPETEFSFRQTATHASSGFGAEGYARDSARSDMVFLASQGFESRMEHDRGREGTGADYRGRPRTFRYSDGFRAFVQGVLELLDAEILRLRQDGWTYPSHYFGHEEYFSDSITEEQRRAWSHENFEMLGWDRSYGRDGRAMTIERMKQIYVERGPLKPSWLLRA